MSIQYALLPYLAFHSDEVVQNASYEQAHHWILELDLIGQFPPPAQKKSYIVGYKGSPTHWIIAGIVYPPYTDANDANFVTCYPRKHFTEEQVTTMTMEDFNGRKMDLRKKKPWEDG